MFIRNALDRNLTCAPPSILSLSTTHDGKSRYNTKEGTLPDPVHKSVIQFRKAWSQQLASAATSMSRAYRVTARTPSKHLKQSSLFGSCSLVRTCLRSDLTVARTRRSLKSRAAGRPKCAAPARRCRYMESLRLIGEVLMASASSLHGRCAHRPVHGGLLHQGLHIFMASLLQPKYPTSTACQRVHPSSQVWRSALHRP
jgi:hypothetical protein